MARFITNSRDRASRKYRQTHLLLRLELSLDKVTRHRLDSENYKQRGDNDHSHTIDIRRFEPRAG